MENPSIFFTMFLIFSGAPAFNSMVLILLAIPPLSVLGRLSGWANACRGRLAPALEKMTKRTMDGRFNRLVWIGFKRDNLNIGRIWIEMFCPRDFLTPEQGNGFYLEKIWPCALEKRFSICFFLNKCP